MKVILKIGRRIKLFVSSVVTPVVPTVCEAKYDDGTCGVYDDGTFGEYQP
jgi:hypothetical protein